MERFQAWIQALRPHTLPASLAPLFVAGGWSLRQGELHLPGYLMALFGAALIQLGTNLINDYQDARRGADTEERQGFTRVTQAGLLEGSMVLRGAWVCFGLAALVGVYLGYIGGWPVIVVGVIGLVAAVNYTGGWLAYGYRGWGDLAVFLFFGPIPVVTTVGLQRYALSGDAWVMAHRFYFVSREVWALSLVPGFLVTAILVVNNHRDRETDSRAGKRTLAVRLGPQGTRLEYTLLLAGAFFVPVVLVSLNVASPWLAFWGGAPYVFTPFAWTCLRRIWSTNDPQLLNQTLTDTGRLAALAGMGLAVGLVFPEGTLAPFFG